MSLSLIPKTQQIPNKALLNELQYFSNLRDFFVYKNFANF